MADFQFVTCPHCRRGFGYDPKDGSKLVRFLPTGEADDFQERCAHTWVPSPELGLERCTRCALRRPV